MIKRLKEYTFILHYANWDYGTQIYVMESHGDAFGCVYFYNDDPKTLYIENLSVDENKRSNGLGTIMLHKLEDICKEFNALKIRLAVDKNSWVHFWYKRICYVDSYIHEENTKIWMSKTLKYE